jgi:divalent metal cation (Fe/Co/Zn/Cd) transporter
VGEWGSLLSEYTLTSLSHRADAMTSLVALASILGSSFGGYTFLDPVGGLRSRLVSQVSGFILQQGAMLSKVALLELLDAGVDSKTQRNIESAVERLVDGEQLLGVRNVRGVKSGGQTQLDLTISVPAGMTVRESHSVEQMVRDAVLKARKDVREVKIHVHGEEEAEREQRLNGAVKGDEKNGEGGPKSDFGADGC